MDLEHVEGLDEVVGKLKKLPQRVGRNAMRRALRKGANVIRDEARRRYKAVDDPRTPTEKIWKNVVVKGGSTKFDKRRGGPTMRVGVLGGARDMSKYGEFKAGGKANPGGDTWYWRLLEFGFTLPSGERYPAKAYMRNSAATKAGAAASAIGTAMDKELDKEIAKL